MNLSDQLLPDEHPGKVLRSLFCSVITLFFVLAGFMTVSAQGTRGTIRGQVTDPAGAVVSGATVKLVDAARRVEVRNVQTNSEGNYQFLEIEPSIYEISVLASGFAETKLKGVRVEPNRNLEINAALSIAGASGEVTVTTASQELIDREAATLGSTVDPQRVVGLPLNGREVLQLTQLQPGVNEVSPATPFLSSVGTAGLGVRVNGNRGVENNLTLDGSNNNDVHGGGAIGVSPRPDAVQEFRMLTSNFEAEFGRNTGSVINVVTKSGTRDYHGNVRVFYRPTFLSAARFFDQNRPTSPPLRGTNDFRRTFERKEFGGQFGGPIPISRKYFGPLGGVNENNDKLFFFVDYEGRRQLIGDTRTIVNVPSLAERSGDFSKLGRVLTDPATGQPFPGNIIQPGRISSIAKYYLQFMSVPDANGIASAGANAITNNDYFASRIDYLLTQKQTLNFTLNRVKTSLVTPFATFGGTSFPGFGAADKQTTLNTVVRHTWSLTPSIINSLLIGYARNNFPATNPLNKTTPAQIGFKADFVANKNFAGPPYIFLVQRGITIGNGLGATTRVPENFQIQDSLSWSRGNHRLKFGFDGTFYKQDLANVFINQGNFTYSRASDPNGTGDEFADFLIGNTPILIQFGANSERDFRQKAAAGFAQDTWRISETLTLSLGLRYEYFTPLSDKYNRVAYYRKGAVSQLLTSGQLKNFEGVPITVPAGRKAPVGIVYVGDPDPVTNGKVQPGGFESDRNNFAPRFGFAWSPKGSNKLLGDRQTVIRGGYGFYYGAMIGISLLNQTAAPGFNGTNSFFRPASGTLENIFGTDPYPNYTAFPGTFPANLPPISNPFTASQLSISAPVSQFSQSIDPRLRTPYVQQYNLTIERGFMKNNVVSLSYVGNRGRKLFALEELNPPLGTFFAAPATYPKATPNNAPLRFENLDVPRNVSQLVSAANSWYDALQINFQHRYSSGLLFQVSYTFSKSLNDVDSEGLGNLDLQNRRILKARSQDDATQRFVTSWIYDLPFAKRFTGAAKKIFDGWSIGGIVSFQSGTPFSITNPFDGTGTGASAGIAIGGIVSYADLGAAYQKRDPRKDGLLAFNPDAFKIYNNPSTPGFDLARDFRRGTSGRNQFRLGNGINNWDLILSKKTQLWSERTGLELRFEAFNAFNHTQFTTVDLNLLSSSFGKFTSARESRVIQLGARFSF